MLDIKYLQECIDLELINGDNLCSFVIFYTSPSQTHDNFETFMKIFELNLDEIKKNPFLRRFDTFAVRIVLRTFS